MKNNNFKQEILATAKKLFYDNGFSNTTIADIAKELNTSNGRINYYFNTKDEIGKAVYTEYLDNVRSVVYDRIYNKFGGYDEALALAIRQRLNDKMYRDYPNAFRFYSDILSITLNMAPERGGEDLNEIYRHFGMTSKLDTANLNLISYSWVGATSMIVIQYFRGYLKIPYEVFDDYRVAVPLRIAGIEEEIIERMVNESKTIFDELKFEVLPYFEVK